MKLATSLEGAVEVVQLQSQVKEAGLSVGDEAAIAAAIFAALGILASAWLTLIAVYRSETRNLLDRIVDQLEVIQEIVGEVWMSPDPYSAAKLRLAEARLTHAGNRLDVLVAIALKKVHVKDRQTVNDHVASIIDRATLGIEDLASDVEALKPDVEAATPDSEAIKPEGGVAKPAGEAPPVSADQQGAVEDHKDRYFSVHRAATAIITVLERDFERWPRKLVWW